MLRRRASPLALPYYPAMFLAPSGKVFYAGPTQSTQYLDVAGNGKWTTVGNRIVASRDYGSAVMYAPGKILYAGGGDPPTQSAEVIDLNDAAPAWRAVPSMAYARRQMLATILADGKVLVTHGTSGGGFNDVTRPVYYAELWNPGSESWTTMAPESILRVYHSTALLLPDGRVLCFPRSPTRSIRASSSTRSPSRRMLLPPTPCMRRLRRAATWRLPARTCSSW